MQYGRKLPMFQRNMVLPSSKLMWRQQVPKKYWYLSIKLHGFTSQRTVIFILVNN
jgi:hypothetical protein